MSKRMWGYLGRFTLLHVVTYLFCGMIMMNLLNYDQAFETMEYFKLYRDLEQPLIAASIIPSQILRGSLMALILYPFYKIYMNKRHGWVLLFLVLYGFTVTFLSAELPEFLINFIDALISGKPLTEFLVGYLEVTLQMFLFSLLFFRWEKKKNENRTI